MCKTVKLNLILYTGFCIMPIPASATTLFDDFGGMQTLNAVMEQFVWNLADDARVNHYWAESNIDRFMEKTTEHLCHLMDGPCEYTGDTMARTHKGMQLDDADFYAVSENLIEAMEAVGVPTGAQNRLLKRLVPLFSDIVENSHI